MKYKDFFRHVEHRAKQKKKERSREEKIRRASEKLAERLGVSPVKALEKIIERLEDSPETVLREWMEAKEDAPKKRKQSLDKVIERLKDEANAPSVGDEVKIEFNEEARGHLTPQQKNMNGAKGIVKVRDPFKVSSQRARYSVEVHESETEDGMPYTIHNLTPGEVVPLDSNEKS